MSGRALALFYAIGPGARAAAAAATALGIALAAAAARLGAAALATVGLLALTAAAARPPLLLAVGLVLSLAAGGACLVSSQHQKTATWAAAAATGLCGNMALAAGALRRRESGAGATPCGTWTCRCRSSTP